ncbi:glycosyltransferase family 4 protein [Desertihabitans aurantiacus]|uniref:glycosyltransferase family 4 protein n=1 Tax=Desertihabitans aurantiacus TaxID=2282477 RepID=UPI000DF74998|nr:glycosyltransferase family 4 protein [Desertihabitans aurantiacus]
MTCAAGRPSRVAVVSDYSFDTLGGAETAMFEQARALAAELDVTVLAPRSSRMPELAGEHQVRVVGVPAQGRLSVLGMPLLRNTPELRTRLRRLLVRREVEVVHLHSEFGLAAAATAAAHDLGIPVVQTVHTFFWQTTWPVQQLLRWGAPAFHSLLTGLRPTRVRLDERPGDSAMRNMTLTQARTVERVVSPSAHQAAALRAAGLERVDVVPNTLSVPAAVSEPLTCVDGPLRVVWVGRVVPEKRPLPLVRAALAAVEQLGPGRLHLTLVGDGEQLAEARALVGDHPEVELVGRTTHARALELIAGAHLCALTSVGWDNQPMTVVEAVSSLRGVLYCDPRLTEGLRSAGILADGADEAALTRLLVELADDPARVVAASRGALTDRREFAPDVFRHRIGDVYTAAAASLR